MDIFIENNNNNMENNPYLKNIFKYWSHIIEIWKKFKYRAWNNLPFENNSLHEYVSYAENLCGYAPQHGINTCVTYFLEAQYFRIFKFWIWNEIFL